MGKIIYDPSEAAEWMALTASEVERMIRSGEIGFILNGEPRISGDEVQRYINRNKKTASGKQNFREGARS